MKTYQTVMILVSLLTLGLAPSSKLTYDLSELEKDPHQLVKVVYQKVYEKPNHRYAVMSDELGFKSRRSLRYLLSKAGTSWREIRYQAIVDRTRDESIKNPGINQATMAKKLGFSPTRNFIRILNEAGKSWTEIYEANLNEMKIALETRIKTTLDQPVTMTWGDLITREPGFRDVFAREVGFKSWEQIMHVRSRLDSLLNLKDLQMETQL